MSAAKLSPQEACAILGLAPDASPHAVIGAFRAAAKAAHPDRPGGDAARFRKALEAYRLLQSLPRAPAVIAPAPIPDPQPHVEIDPLTALAGGEADAVLGDGRRVRARIPPGARHGDTLGVGDAIVKVRVTPRPDVQLRGSDLWVTAEIAAAVLAQGGRVRVATPLGDKALWISRKAAERGLVRLEGQGLPARGRHGQGSLFVRLVADAGAPESAARTRLRRFAAAWAA